MENLIKSIPWRTVAALLLLSCGSGGNAQDQKAGDLTFSGESLTLPLVQKQIHPLIMVGPTATEQYRFVVDTGASVNVIDSDVAARLGYEVIGQTEIGAPGGRRIPANIVSVPLLHVGEATIEDAEFVTMNLNVFSGGLMQGVLGIDLFSSYLLTFDGPAREIRVSYDKLSEGDAGVLSYDSESAHIQIDLDVSGHTIATHVDTGSMANFTLPVELMSTLSLNEAPKSGGRARMVGGPRNIQNAQLDGSIRFADLAYEEPTIGFMDPSPGYGNLGSGILRDLIMSVDQRSQLVSFREPEGSIAASTNQKPRRLGVGFRGVPGGTTLSVASVADGSIGAQSGILVGDVLTSLNGKPMSDYDMPKLGELFGGQTSLTLEIERGEEMLTIEIP